MTRPTLVYDGDCGICTKAARLIVPRADHGQASPRGHASSRGGVSPHGGGFTHAGPRPHEGARAGDGACPGGRRRVRVPTDAEVVAFQFADVRALGTTAERAAYELLWVEDGRVYGGAQAVARLLIGAGGLWKLAGLLLRVPPARWAAHGLYRLVANNRHRLPGGTPACALPAARRHARAAGPGSSGRRSAGPGRAGPGD